MAHWGTHFAIGGACTTLLIWAYKPEYRYRAVIVFAGGTWAIIPDVHWVVPPLWTITKPVIHDTSLANVFWFHGWIDASILDVYDTRRRPYLSVPMLLGFLGIYWLTTPRNPRQQEETSDESLVCRDR